MSGDLDTSQITRLAVDLGQASPKLLAAVGPILSKASVKIKAGMRASLERDSEHFGRAGADVRYEITGLSSEIYVETGRGPGHQGGLAWIAAHGTATQGPSWDYTKALHDEAPVFEGFLAVAANKAIL